MTEVGQSPPPPVVTALHLESPTIPYETPPPDPAYPKPSATASHASSKISHATEPLRTTIDESQLPTSQPLSQNETSIGQDLQDSRPQLVKKNMTERPRPAMRSSLLGMRRAGTSGAPNLGRQTTLTFDPYLSSSSSSSEDEGDAESKARKKKQKQAKRTDSDGGPFSKFTMGNDNFQTKGWVSRSDGRLKLSVNEALNHNGYFAKTLGSGLRKHFRGGEDTDEDGASSGDDEDVVDNVPPEAVEMEDPKTRLKLNIVVIVIGSRGDIQPFIKIGKTLKEEYGHRVRIATHPAFKDFVEKDSSLEFFSVGGDPSELMAFMVKNPGLIPSMETIKEGEIGKRRAAMFGMFKGMWRACINATDDEDDVENLKMRKT